MHELGIVFYIIRDVKKAAQEHGVEHVSAVVMNIGEVSTIVPEYLIVGRSKDVVTAIPDAETSPLLHSAGLDELNTVRLPTLQTSVHVAEM